jgi:hypothetical protein
MTMVKTVFGGPVLHYRYSTEVREMKFSAVIAALTILAAPALGQAWAPAVNADTLAAFEAPAAAPAEAVNPRDGENYSGAEELLIKEFGITAVGLDFPETEVMRQSSFYDNMFCVEHALRLALFDLLENYANPTSPLARALGEIGAQQTPSKSELKKARQKVMEKLNTPKALISIVRPYHFSQPLNGETVERNWIFFFRLEGKPYWAVVDRAGNSAPYVYGAE